MFCSTIFFFVFTFCFCFCFSIFINIDKRLWSSSSLFSLFILCSRLLKAVNGRRKQIVYLFILFLFLFFFSLSSSPSTNFFIVVRPLNVRITTEKSPLVADRLIIIDCVSEGARPPVLISWWMSSTRLLNATTDEIITNGIYPSPSIRKDHQTVSRLHLLPSANDNGQILSCRADHSVLSDSSLDDSWRLNVLCKYLYHRSR